MQRTLVDGVTVLWAPGPAPLRAELVFGCGVRDETFRTLGVTHLIEHLAMSTLPRLHHEHNASVDLEATRFTAAGRPEQIVAFLATVCAALSDLPLDRIEHEAGVLTAEASSPTFMAAAVLLNQRLGAQGAGLAPYAGPGYDRLDADIVRRHAAAHFTRGNAVLLLTGPPPEGLRLPLPEGRPPRRTAPAVTVGPGGASWDEAPIEGAALALAGPVDSAAAALGYAVLEHRLTELARHRRGLSYAVQFDASLRHDLVTDTVVWLDARPGRHAEIAELLWTEALRLGREVPSAEELAEEIEGFREAYEDPRAVEAELDRAATAELFGLPFRDHAVRLAALRAVTPEEVRDAFAQAMATARLAVAPDVEPRLTGPEGNPLPRGGCCADAALPAGEVFRPPLLARALYGGARRSRLVLTASGIAETDGDGRLHVIPFDEVVGVERDGTDRTLFGASGCVIALSPGKYSGCGRVVRAVDTAVPAALAYEVSALTPKDGDDD
ncbi:M16 family metallopeptidase [Streptomyces sp. NPDC090022]|uniref:M16 family metallopeptidase n=1 Tax=Streptomyces sp. NPDC090022 TaxID=3365920 RepID=UPI003818CD38